MLAWLLDRVHETAAFLRIHDKCPYCGLYYRKKLGKCNHCSDLSDSELGEIFQKRRQFRITLGGGMLAVAASIVVLMLVWLN